MISFEQFQIRKGVPVYLQIIEFIERGIAAGTIQHGDEMPSRRMLSALLGVNPNTVQKAYHSLEDCGIIRSRSGAKSFVTADDTLKNKIRADLLTQDIDALVQKMKQTGISCGEAVSLIEDAWNDRKGD